MKVTAIRAGFFGGALHEAGATFEVPDGEKATWFVPTDSKPPKPPKPAKDQPKALSELAAPGKSFTDALA